MTPKQEVKKQANRILEEYSFRKGSCKEIAEKIQTVHVDRQLYKKWGEYCQEKSARRQRALSFNDWLDDMLVNDRDRLAEWTMNAIDYSISETVIIKRITEQEEELEKQSSDATSDKLADQADKGKSRKLVRYSAIAAASATAGSQLTPERLEGIAGFLTWLAGLL